MSKGLVEIYDTTLRDGTQGEGVSFSVADKLRVAEKLDAFGVHYVEGGWPGSNPKDIEFFKQAAKRKWKNAEIAAFGSTRRKKIAAKDDPQVRLLLDAKNSGGNDLWQDVAFAREGSAAHDAKGKHRDDRRHHRFPKKE